MDSNTIRYLLLALGGAPIIVGIGAVIIHFLSESKGAKSVAEAAQIITPFILIITLVVLYRQLEHIQEQNSHTQAQNDLQRAVASKSAIQALNEVILSKEQRDEFLPFIFPDLIDEGDPEPGMEQARKTMMAFSLMNSLELLYLAQDEEVKRDDCKRKDFKRLLRGFTGTVHGIWSDEFATVYHPDFKEIVEEVFAEK